jgi:hypothetical protein
VFDADFKTAIIAQYNVNVSATIVVVEKQYDSLFVALGIQHAMRMRRIIQGVS